MCVCVCGSVCLWRESSENSLVELDFLKALSSQRWIGCKICQALWKIAREKEEEVRKDWWLGGRHVGVEGMISSITTSFRAGRSRKTFSYAGVHIL